MAFTEEERSRPTVLTVPKMRKAKRRKAGRAAGIAPQRQGNLMAPEEWRCEVPAAEYRNILDMELWLEPMEYRARQLGHRELQVMPWEQRVQELNAAVVPSMVRRLAP